MEIDNSVEEEEEEEFGFSRNYFLAKELGGSGKKSASKLSDIDLVGEQELRTAASNIEPKHEKEVMALMNSYMSLYPKWVFELRQTKQARSCGNLFLWNHKKQPRE